jgi:hypothetical protein
MILVIQDCNHACVSHTVLNSSSFFEPITWTVVVNSEKLSVFRLMPDHPIWYQTAVHDTVLLIALVCRRFDGFYNKPDEPWFTGPTMFPIKLLGFWVLQVCKLQAALHPSSRHFESQLP